MKKINTLLTVLTTSLLLTGCNGGGKAQWKEYTFKRVLSDAEKLVLLAKVEAATYSKISKLSYSSYSETKRKLYSDKHNNKASYEFFKNGEYYFENSTDRVRKDDNREIKDKYTNKQSYVLYDAEKHEYATFREYGQNHSFDYSQETRSEGIEPIIINEAICERYEAIEAMTAYEDKKGNYFFLNSSEVETYTPVSYGHYTREKHDVQKHQHVVLLNKDYSIKSETDYMLHKTNRDSDTNEFYKGLQKDMWSEDKYEFSYKERKDAPKNFADLRAQAKEGYRLGSVDSVKVKLFKADATELTEAALTQIQSKHVGFGKEHFVYQITNIPASFSENEVKTLKFKFAGNSISNAKEDPVAIDADINIGSLVAGNAGVSLVDGVINMGKANVKMTIEFDLEATAEGATFTNVAAYAELCTESV